MNIDSKECNILCGQFVKNARKNVVVFLEGDTVKTGMSQKELADRVGITQSYLSYLESGVKCIDLSLAIKICDVLGLEIQEFIKQLK